MKTCQYNLLGICPWNRQLNSWTFQLNGSGNKSDSKNCVCGCPGSTLKSFSVSPSKCKWFKLIHRYIIALIAFLHFCPAISGLSEDTHTKPRWHWINGTSHGDNWIVKLPKPTIIITLGFPHVPCAICLPIAEIGDQKKMSVCSGMRATSGDRDGTRFAYVMGYATDRYGLLVQTIKSLIM